MKKTINIAWMTAGIMIAASLPANAQHSTTPRSLRPQVEAASGGAGEAPPAKEIKDDLFAGTEKFAKNATDVSEVSMDPETLGMVGGKDGDLAKAMKLTVVRSYTYDKPGMYRMEDVEEFRKKLETGEWHCSVHIRELKTGESTDVCNKHRSDDLTETAIITVEPKELTFIHTIGTGWGGNYKGKKGGKDDSRLHGFDSSKLDVQMAVLDARFASMGPMIDAGLGVLGPELDATLAVLSARLAAMPPIPPMPKLNKLPNLDILPNIPEPPPVPDAVEAHAPPAAPAQPQP